MKKWLNGAAIELPPSLRAPDPVNPCSKKNDPPANLFLLHVLPQSVINLHWLFNMSNINTHFDMFLKN